MFGNWYLLVPVLLPLLTGLLLTLYSLWVMARAAIPLY